MNDLLDKILDGEPVLIVFTPELRRQLANRRAERYRERREQQRTEPDHRVLEGDLWT